MREMILISRHTLREFNPCIGKNQVFIIRSYRKFVQK